jgi:hypothetical protein
MTQIETERHEAIVEFMKWNGILYNTDPSSPYRSSLQAKVDELELVAIGMAVEDTPEAPEAPALEVPVIASRKEAWLALSIIVTGCIGWGYSIAVIAKRLLA